MTSAMVDLASKLQASASQSVAHYDLVAKVTFTLLLLLLFILTKLQQQQQRKGVAKSTKTTVGAGARQCRTGGCIARNGARRSRKSNRN
jgi:heme A synthase